MISRRFLRRYAGFFRYLTAVTLAFCFIGTGLVAGGLLAVRDELPDAEQLVTYRPRLTTELYSTEVDKQGKTSHTLLARIATEDREPVSLQDVPLCLRQATIAIEDRPFYEHRGVDPKGIARAMWVNLKHGGIRQGGSTITQQLVRNMWLTQRRTWDRKIREALLALEVERRYSKDEILEMYLNEVYYGHRAYGVKVAARTYFGKDVKDLELAEAALLAGLPRSPTNTDPYRSPQRARDRRSTVLQVMVESGFITPQEAAEASKHQIQANLAPLEEEEIIALHAPYFTHMVIRELCDEYGQDTIYQGGLRIFTSIDLNIQEMAEEELGRQVKSLRSSGAIKRALGQGALACVEVNTGDVLAMVGGVGEWEKNQYNRAHPGPPQWGRQPGSSFKPYVWATALEHGYGPESQFSGSALTWGNWHPKNYSTHQGGMHSLRHALAQSVNLVSARLVRKLGVRTVQRSAARMMGIPEVRLRPVPAIALGTSELSPLEQAIGYCTFATGGLRVKPRFVKRVENVYGDLVLEVQPDKKRVINKATAVSMISMMRTVVTSGTGTRASVPGYAACGKTGTTQSGRDAWWVGYTPDLSCAVWIGNDDYKPMRGTSGGGFCGPVFRRFMSRALEYRGYNGKYPEGSGVRASRSGESGPREKEEEEKEAHVVTICTETGGLATQYCPSTAEKTIPPGGAMPGRCTRHRAPAGPSDGGTGDTSPGSGEPSGGTVTVTVCAESGQPAGPYCPQTVERSYPAGSAPGGSCSVHGPRGGGGTQEPSGGGTTTPGGGSTEPPPANHTTGD